MEYFTLNNGIKMPMAGIGTFMIAPADAEKAVESALRDGIRLIYTANAYMNESATGRGIKNSGVPREEIFLVSKLWLFYLDKSQNKKKLYLAGSLSLCVLLVPMTVSMVKTILEKDAPVYFFFWTIYLYATYGTVKFIMAVKTRHKARKSGDVLSDVKSMLSLVTACYTIQMMEFALIATFDSAKSNSMQVMQFMTHGAVIIFTAIVIFLLFAKYRRSDR